MLCSKGDPGTSYFPLFSPFHWNLYRQVSDNGGSRISQTGVLNIGSIRIYILTTGVVSNETNTYVRMYI